MSRFAHKCPIKLRGEIEETELHHFRWSGMALHLFCHLHRFLSWGSGVS